MHASSKDTQRQYEHCQEGWEKASSDAENIICDDSGRDFRQLYEKMNVFRASVAKQLVHGSGFGRLRSNLMCEDFYFNMGSPLDEAWVGCKKAVYKSYQELLIRESMGKGLKTDTSYLTRRGPAGGLSMICKTVSQTSKIESRTYKVKGSELMQTILEISPHYERGVSDVVIGMPGSPQSELLRVLLSVVPKKMGSNEFLSTNPVNDLSCVTPDNSLVKFAEMADELCAAPGGSEILKGLVDSLVSDGDIKSAKALLLELQESDSHYVNDTLGIPRCKISLADNAFDNVKLMADTLREPVAPNCALKRLKALVTKHPEKEVALKLTQVMLNTQCENGQKPIRGQTITELIFDGKILSMGFKAYPFTEESHLQASWKYAQHCYERVLDTPKCDIKQFMDHTAKFMHYMAHMIPVERGNAGIMQWFLYALAKKTWIVLPPLVGGDISWDFKAISSTHEQFKSWWVKSAFKEDPRVMSIHLSDTYLRYLQKHPSA